LPAASGFPESFHRAERDPGLVRLSLAETGENVANHRNGEERSRDGIKSPRPGKKESSAGKFPKQFEFPSTVSLLVLDCSPAMTSALSVILKNPKSELRNPKQTQISKQNRPHPGPLPSEWAREKFEIPNGFV